ncbi:MAG TPA: alpha/beta hydrolase [Solirubrobacteraceae bacterium]|jgi:pimeloyl-ACP methyl ester carboxylesterase|nr:alpha/beta hydrolase [Solirubrobacteraceae bacterium]
MPDAAREFTVLGDDGVALSGEESGGAGPVVLLHGLTATRRYVVMGSTALQRAGHRVISYDARGHGRSAPAADSGDYGYERLTQDLASVLDDRGVERALLAGASMGAHTAVRYALEHPEGVAALAIITPAFDPATHDDDTDFARWDRLARGLRAGGVEGFVSAYELDNVPETFRATIATVLRQRLSAHEHPDAVADALEVVPRSRPFEDFAQLAAIAVPTLVVASRDEADPGHPLAVGERYASAIPGAELIVEDAGAGGVDGHPISSPIAWQGGQLSRAIGELASRSRA